MNRKKRRGVIEKKRRDRINSSLVELKRLVPSAFEKQGSAKLEKAEILQLTVDHLRSLHAKGKPGISNKKIFSIRDSGTLCHACKLDHAQVLRREVFYLRNFRLIFFSVPFSSISAIL